MKTLIPAAPDTRKVPGGTTAALIGGFLAHYVGKREDRVGGETGRSMERGVIIASGLMAGGALGGVFGASFRLFPWYNEELITPPFFANEPVSQTVSAALSSPCAVGALPLRSL